MSQSLHLPRGAGVSFKPQHFADITATKQPLGFFEIHAENYMGAGGLPHAQLNFIRSHYALSVHGVGLSIGAPQPLDRNHLARLKHLCERTEPHSVSEHLAWSTHESVFFNDLLPLPYTEETLNIVVAHIDELQTKLGRQILLENPATYVRLAQSTIPEPEFMREIARRGGCALLLDVNNIFVSAINHGTDPFADLSQFPIDEVREIHLAGHAESDDGIDRILIDAHGSAVADPIMALYAHLIAAAGPLPTLIEWDNDVPAWPRLLREALAAQAILDAPRNDGAGIAAAA
jgi:uncharacterized protein (UPF0276 family)